MGDLTKFLEVVWSGKEPEVIGPIRELLAIHQAEGKALVMVARNGDIDEETFNNATAYIDSKFLVDALMTWGMIGYEKNKEMEGLIGVEKE